MNKTISFISALGMFTLITIGCEDITQKTIEENSSSSLSSSSSFSSSVFSLSSSSSLSSLSSSSSFASSSSQESGINSTQSKNSLGYYGEDTLFANRKIKGWWGEYQSEVVDGGVAYFMKWYGFDTNGTGLCAIGSRCSDFKYGVGKDGKRIHIEFIDENEELSTIELTYIEPSNSCSLINKQENNQTSIHKVCKVYANLIAVADPVRTIPLLDTNNTFLAENTLGYYGNGVKFAGYNIVNTFQYEKAYKFHEDGTVNISEEYDHRQYNQKYNYGVDENGSTLIMSISETKDYHKTITWKYLGYVEDCIYIEEHNVGDSNAGFLGNSWDYKDKIRVCKSNVD